ncbi:MAG: hypothetical protein PVH59_08870 [Anaerolineae bacterium]
MSEGAQVTKQSYTLAQDEKAVQVMIGTADALIWGDLVTKEQVRMSAYLNTLAEEYISLFDAKLLFLAPQEQTPPIERSSVHIRQQAILVFFVLHDEEPLPEETQTRQYEPIEGLVGSYQVEGNLLKPPISSVQNTLMVSKAAYMPIYNATVRHVAKPWLGSFSSHLIHIRCERMILNMP